MTDDFKKIFILAPRKIKALKNHSNYIVQNKKFPYKNRMIEFSIEDDRESHGTITKIIGLDEDISVLGYGILFKSNRILQEQWNDSELNCWLEYNIENKEEIYIRLSELGPYLLSYIPEKEIRDKYLEEIQQFFSTEAFNYVHYYFTSDQNADEEMLKKEIGNLTDPQKQWKTVKKIVQEHIDQNTKDTTWRAICIMIKSNENFFKGTAIESTVLSEIHLCNEVLGWGGKTQLEWMAIMKKYLPIYRTMYEITDEKDRNREIWHISVNEIFPDIYYRKIAKYRNEQNFEEYSQVINIAKRGDNKDKLIVRTILKMLSNNKHVNKDVRAFLKKQTFIK